MLYDRENEHFFEAGDKMKRERLIQIYNYIEKHENVSTLELTKTFQVSEMTIRRDLATLEEQGKISRFHGGATIRNMDTSEATFELRRTKNPELKTLIGARGMEYLQDYISQNHPYSIFLGSGSTIYYMVRQSNTAFSVPIVTDNLYVSTLLAVSEKNTVIMIGGQLTLPSLNTTGHMAEKALSDFTIDCAFIGSSAIDEQGNLYAYNLLEAGMFSTIISASKHIVVLADHSKIGKRNLVYVQSLDKRFTLITDDAASEKCLSKYRELGAQVVIAENQDTQASDFSEII